MNFCIGFCVALMALWATSVQAQNGPKYEVLPFEEAFKRAEIIKQYSHALERVYREEGFLKFHPEFTLTTKGAFSDELTLAYHAREYATDPIQARRYGGTGKEVGPAEDGIIIRIGFGVPGPDSRMVVLPGLTLEPLLTNDKSARLERSQAMSHEGKPLWTNYYCRTTLIEKQIVVSVRVQFGEKTDRKLIEEAFAPIQKVFANEKKYDELENLKKHKVTFQVQFFRVRDCWSDIEFFNAHQTNQISCPFRYEDGAR